MDKYKKLVCTEIMKKLKMYLSKFKEKVICFFKVEDRQPNTDCLYVNKRRFSVPSITWVWARY